MIRRPLALPAMVLVLVLGPVGCAVTGDLLGGRDRCWTESDPRLAALMRGTLELDVVSSLLDTPEGERLPLSFGALAVRSNDAGRLAILDGGGATLATDGEDVTLFGGLGSDGSMLVCAVEERHGD